MEWPAGVDPNQASSPSDYPADIWAQATSRWEQMPDADRQAYRESLGEQVRKNIEESYAQISQEAFFGSFAAMDLLFFGLAIVTAYKIAASEQEGATSSDDGEEASS